MSSTDETATATSAPAAHANQEAGERPSASTAASSKDGSLWGWRNRLMHWRSGGGGENDDGDGSAPTTDPSNTADTAKDAAVDTTSTTTAATTTATAAQPKGESKPPVRQMNIWLRRALERQAESAIAEAIRDGKPLPAAPVTDAASVAAGKTPEQSSEAVDTATEERSDAVPSAAAAADATTTTCGAVRISFADLMRQHREGLLAPSSQPPVKATKVVKKPKAATAEPSAESASTTPTSKKRKSKAALTPVPGGSDAAPAEASAETAKDGDDEAPKREGAAVHKGAVRKRAKASSPLNSASAKCTHDTSTAASAMATPTQTITIKGKMSLEELRARRNRTTSSALNTPSPLASGTGGAAGAQSTDGYNEGALEAVSQLLLRYCLGDASKSASDTPSEATVTTNSTTSELNFFNQLMELCESNSLTPESLELLRELFQHVRVLPRPSSSVASPGEATKEGDVASGAEAPTAMDAEAYRDASRRREYVQQVIMVLINRLKQLKLHEQQREQLRQVQAAAAAAVGQSANNTTNASAGAPQAVIGHAMPSVRVGGVAVNPLPSIATATQPAPSVNTQQRPQHPSALPATLSYDEQMRRLAEWRAMAEIASGNGVEDEAAAAAAFASTMAAYGYPNPYAHLTVFSQHQPVAPPVGWLSGPTSRSSSGSAGARRGRGGQSASVNENHNVASRLMPSPFPGAFPILPPPSSSPYSGTASTPAEAKEDREMQELFSMIRNQLTQPTHSRGEDSRTTTSNAPPAPATVDVSQAERAVLRHVQNDFKQRMEKQQQQQQQQQQQSNDAATGDSPAPQIPPTASTPPTASLDAPDGTSAASHRTLFTPQRTSHDAEAEAGAAPTARSTTASPAPENGEIKSATPSATAPAATTFNLAAKPFVPRQQPAVAAEGSTPTKTKFNYKATPFVPGGAAGRPSAAAPVVGGESRDSATPPQRTAIRYDAAPFVPGAADTQPSMPSSSSSSSAPLPPQMSVHAKPFVPAAQHRPPQASTTPSLALPASHHINGAATARHAFPDGMLGSADASADPWASYEMFARWRDMMEAYYQGVFDAQQTGAGATPTLTTPPRRA